MPKRAKLPHCEAEAEDDDAMSRREVDANSNATVGGAVVPRATAQHTARAFCATCPFPYIAAHSKTKPLACFCLGGFTAAVVIDQATSLNHRCLNS